MQLPIFEKYIDELIEKSTLDVPAWNIEKAREGKAAGWNYIDGCMILALLEIYSATGEKKYYEFADAFIDYRLGRSPCGIFPCRLKHTMRTGSCPH